MGEIPVAAGPAKGYRSAGKGTLMRVIVGHDSPARRRTNAKTASLSKLRFDYQMAIICLWPMIGLYIDGWAHNSNKAESFFTPWHAVFYSGLLAVATVLGMATVRNRAAGNGWRDSIPENYLISFIGVMIFGVSGLGDLAWHEVLGIEAGVEALLSPTHLGLAFGGALIVCGPILAVNARRKGGSLTWTEGLPIILCLAFLLSNLTFWTQFGHPLVRPLATTTYLYKGPGLVDPVERENFIEALGVASILLQGAIFTGVALFAQSRWRLPLGAPTVILVTNGALVVSLREHYQLVGAPVTAGLIADCLARYFNPSPQHLTRWLTFAFLIPATYFSTYYVILLVTDDIWWPTRLWVGSIVLAGVMGLLLGLLFVNPLQHPAIERRQDEVI